MAGRGEAHRARLLLLGRRGVLGSEPGLHPGVALSAQPSHRCLPSDHRPYPHTGVFVRASF